MVNVDAAPVSSTQGRAKTGFKVEEVEISITLERREVAQAGLLRFFPLRLVLDLTAVAALAKCFSTYWMLKFVGLTCAEEVSEVCPDVFQWGHSDSRSPPFFVEKPT